MKVIIVGAGEVGQNIARRLSSEGHDIYLVEQDAAVADAASELDVTVIRGNGARPKVMDEVFRMAGNGVELLVACTNRDEANMIACLIARKRGVKRVIARARNLEFTDSGTWARELGIDQIISPERSVAREITGLVASSSTRTEDLLDGRAALYVFRVEAGSVCDGKSLEAIRQDEACRELRFVVVYVERGKRLFPVVVGQQTQDLLTEQKAEISDSMLELDGIAERTGPLVPDGKTVLHAGDQCYVVMLKRDVEKLETLFQAAVPVGDAKSKKNVSHSNKNSNKIKRVFIVGGGKVGYQVARQIRREYGSLSIRIVDSDPEQCAQLAEDFGALLVLNTDGADREMLLREGIRSAGYVAATSNDELNLIYAVVAKSLGARRSIAVVRQSRYQDLPSIGLPVDAIVNTNEALASVILGEVRYPGTARTLSIIENIDAEMLELVIPDGFESRKIMDLALPRGEIVALRARGDEVLVPGGATVLSPGDRIILFAATARMQDAVNFFKAKSDGDDGSASRDVGVFGS